MSDTMTASQQDAFVPLENVERSEWFGGLSFQEQQQVRDQWYREMVPKMPGFDQLDDRERQMLYAQTMTLPPIFETGDLSPSGMQFLQIAQELRDLANSGELDREDDAARQARHQVFKQSVIENFGTANIIARIAASISGTDPQSIGLNLSSEDDKAFQYLVQQGSRDPEIRKELQRLSAAGTIGGVIGDIGVSLLMVAPFRALAKAPLAAMKKAIPGTHARFLKGTLLPQIGFEIAEGAVMTGFDLYRSAYNDEIAGNQKIANDTLRVATLFGTNALFDIGAWSIMRIMGRAFGSMAQVGRKGLRPHSLPDGTNVSELVREGLVRNNMEFVNSLNPKDREQVFRAVREADLMKNLHLEDVGTDPWIRGHLAAKGFEIDDVADGIHIRWGGSPEVNAQDIGTFKTYREALQSASDWTDINIRKVTASGDAVKMSSEDVTIRKVYESDFDSVKFRAKGVDLQGGKLTTERLRRILGPDVNGNLNGKNLETALNDFYAKSESTRVDRLNRNVTREANLTQPIERTIHVRQVDPKVYDEIKGNAQHFQGNAPNEYTPLITVDGKTYTYSGDFIEGKDITLILPNGPLDAQKYYQIDRFYRILLPDGGSPKSQQTLRKGIREGYMGIERKGSLHLPEITKSDMERYLGDGEKIKFTGPGVERYLSRGVDVVDESGNVLQHYHNAVEFMMKRGDTLWINLDIVKRYAEEEFGIIVYRKDNRFWMRRMTERGKSHIIRAGEGYESLEQLLVDNPNLFPKRPINMIPGNQITIDYNAGKVEITGATFRGNYHDSLKWLSHNVKDYGKETKQVLNTKLGRVEFLPGNPRFTVRFNDSDFVKEFTSLEEAKKFLRGGWDDWENLHEIALASDVLIRRSDGMFYVHFPDGTTEATRSLEGVADALKKVPGEQIQKNLLEGVIPIEMEEKVTQNIKKYLNADVGRPKIRTGVQLESAVKKDIRAQKMAPPSALGEWYRLYQEQLRSIARSFGGDDELIDRAFRFPMAGAVQVRKQGQIYEEAIERLSKNVNRKQAYAMVNALPYLDDPAKMADEFKALGLEITENDRYVLSEVRQMFNDLGDFLGIDGEAFLKDYLPRVKRTLTPQTGIQITEGMSGRQVMKILNLDFSQNKTIRFFAENMRGLDIAQMAQTDDIFDLLDLYVRRGLKAKYMRNPLKDAQEYVGQLVQKGTINDHQARFIVGFVEELAGVTTDPTKHAIIEGIEKALHGFLRAVGVKNPKTVEHHIRTIRSLTTSALLSAKPFMVIRNLQQPWGTLAHRLGNQYVAEAYDKVTKEAPKIVQQLLDMDLITTGRAPIQQMQEELTRTVLDKMNRWGMYFYANSDAYNRAIAATAAWIPFDESVELYRRGKLSPEEFLKRSRVNQLEDDAQRLITSYIDRGDVPTARRLVAENWLRETQFDYVHAQNPKVAKGVLGQLYGKYIHYSLGHIESMRKTFSIARDPGEKLASAMRVGLNTAALYFFFEKVLHINASSFNPIKQGLFSGGPYWDLMHTGMQSLQFGYRGKIARSELPGQVGRTFIPFNYLYTSHEQARSLYERGYIWESMMRQIGIPVIDQDKPTAR